MHKDYEVTFQLLGEHDINSCDKWTRLIKMLTSSKNPFFLHASALGVAIELIMFFMPLITYFINKCDDVA